MTDLRATNLRAADLRAADLRAADVRGDDLRGDDLRAADLRATNVRGDDLRAADLRACPREDQAGVAHAISPISLKLGLVKGFTQKLHRLKPFDLWIFPSKYRPPPLVFQGKSLKTH